MTPPPSTASLLLAGAPRCRLADGRVLDLAPPDALLLAWLAVQGPSPRQRLAELLWPGSSADQARNALRQRLFRLRRQCGCELVEGSGTLALAPGVDHDLSADGPLLAPLDAADGAELDAWLQAERRRRSAATGQDLEARSDAAERAGELAEALALADERLRAEPLSEDAHRRLIRLHYLRGDRAAALLAFDRLEAVLKHEVGAQPSPESMALLKLIEGAATPSPPRAGDVPAAVLRPPRLIGRERDLAALRAAWAAGQVVLLLGEAGMGKSRLLQAMADETAACVFASARPGDELVPYASLGRLLQPVLARLDTPPGAALREDLAPLLPGLATAPARPPRRVDLSVPVRELLARARGRIGGLVLDDLHFADAASVELLQALLAAPRGGEATRWCLGSRPAAPGTPLDAFVAALGRAGPLARVELVPLDTPQLAELVDSLALPGLDGATLAPALRQRSGGNPLFALETLKLAWAEGLPRGGGELPRPQSLMQLIGLQLARLSAPALALARVAAVAGLDFGLALAEQVLGQDTMQLADPWRELELQHVMVGTEFAHDLVHEAVLAGVPAVIARHLHARVAGWLEANAGEPARVAAHWEAADQPRRALPALRAAAGQAHRALRENERITLLLRAATIAEAEHDTEAAYDCVALALEAHINAIRQADGYPLLDRLDTLADTPARRARALGLRAWYCSQLGDNERAAALGAEALAAAEAAGDAMLAGQTRHRLATALAMLGRFDAALAQFETMQDWAGAHLAAEDRAEYHGNFAVVLDNLGRPERALPHHRQAIDTSAAAQDHWQQTTHLANHAVSRLNSGDVAGAAASLAQARTLISRYALQGSRSAFVAVLQLQCARALGRYREALATADEAEALLRAAMPSRLPALHVVRAHCWLDLGQLARAGQSLRQAAEAGRLPAHLEVRRLVLQARLERWLGRDGTRGLVEAEAALPPNGWPEARMIVAVERACGLPADEALALMEQTLAEARTLGLGGSVLAALLRLAGLGAVTAPARAADAAREALALAGTLEPTMLGRGDLWLAAAQALRTVGDPAAAQALAAGDAWLEAVAREQVDPEFRDSFLGRNPVHAALRALAAAS